MTAEEPNLGDLLSQVQQMQQRLMDAQQSAVAQSVQGRAGGGVVTVTLTGGMEVLDVKIDRSVVDPDDVQMLEDLVLAAMRDALAQAEDLSRQALGGLGLGDVGLGELGFEADSDAALGTPGEPASETPGQTGSQTAGDTGGETSGETPGETGGRTGAAGP